MLVSRTPKVQTFGFSSQIILNIDTIKCVRYNNINWMGQCRLNMHLWILMLAGCHSSTIIHYAKNIKSTVLNLMKISEHRFLSTTARNKHIIVCNCIQGLFLEMRVYFLVCNRERRYKVLVSQFLALVQILFMFTKPAWAMQISTAGFFKLVVSL